jgi:hypothetical protein
MANRDSKSIKKLEYHLLPFDVLDHVVAVLMDGKYRPRPANGDKPYGANNWRTPPYFTREDIYNSLQRHIISLFFHGETFDPDSKERHAAHIVCNAIFALYYDMYDLWDKEHSELLTVPTSTESPAVTSTEDTPPSEETTPSLPPTILAYKTVDPSALEELRQKVMVRWRESVGLPPTE